MRSHSKKEQLTQIRSLNKELIDELYKELTNELKDLINELNDSSKIGAYGAMATLSNKISEIAADIKKLQRLPNMLRNPFVLADPREILDEIENKYSNKKKKSKGK